MNTQRRAIGVYILIGLLLVALRVVIASNSSHMSSPVTLVLNLLIVVAGIGVVISFFRRFRER